MQGALPAQLLTLNPATSRSCDVQAIRTRALERLYARRAAVDALIESLEGYAETRRLNRAPCIPFSAAPK